MKKVAIIAILFFAVGLIMSSCNKDKCPTYAQVDADQIENLG